MYSERQCRKTRVVTYLPELRVVEDGLEVMPILKLLGKNMFTILGRLVVEERVGYRDGKTCQWTRLIEE